MLNRAKVACTRHRGESEDESEEEPSATSSDKGVRYMIAEMCEVSDPEVWMEYHHGNDDEPRDTPEEERTEAERSLLAEMRSTNELLTARHHRLEAEWDEAQQVNDLESMDLIENLIRETRGLRSGV